MKWSLTVPVMVLAACVGGCSLPGGGLMTAYDGGAPTADATLGGDDGSSPQDDAASADASGPADDASDGQAGAGSDSAHDAGGTATDAADASAEGATPCPSPTLTACVDARTGASVFCSGARACAACVDGRDDPGCTTAYGGAASPYLCVAGACVPGECRAAADCSGNAKGPLCGVSSPHLCGPCTTDVQCAGAALGAPTCNPATGQCVAGLCTSNRVNPPAVCPVSAGDVCCAGHCQAGGPGACCPGPAAGTYCAGILGRSKAGCTGGVCAVCPPPSGGVYWVDPVNGSDKTGTGATAADGCALKTITAALGLIGAVTVPTTVMVVGPATVGAGETFPIPLPENVKVVAASGAVTVQVPASDTGFVLAFRNSGLVGSPSAPLALVGTGGALNGVVVNTGSQLTTQVTGVTISQFDDSGLLVQGSGVLSIGPGLVATLNGAGVALGAGLHVAENGHVEIGVSAGAPPTRFDANAVHGITVNGNASVTLSGAVTNALAGTGTVTTNGNGSAGLYIGQTSTNPPLNTITGLVSFGAVSGNGIRFRAGSRVTLRQSVSLGNAGAGLLVDSGTNSADVTGIDLGSGTDYGHNVFQAAGASENKGDGLCMAGVNGTLLATGNVFRAVSCDSTAGVLTLNANNCNGKCSGLACDVRLLHDRRRRRCLDVHASVMAR